MCKQPIHLLLILTVQIAFAQYPPSPNKLDDKGRRTGHWTILYDSTFQKEVKDLDSVHYFRIVYYVDGKPSGKVRDYYRTGQKQWDGEMISLNPVTPHGSVNYYFQNGQVQYSLTYDSGKLNGPYKQYSTLGVLVSEGNIKNDSTDGLVKDYDADGKITQEVYYNSGVEHGLKMTYHPNGQVKEKGQMVWGKRDGVWLWYHENGVLNTRVPYQNNKRHGFWEWFNDTGFLEQTGFYENGLNVGQWKNFYADGKTLYSEGVMDTVGKQGPWIYYFENGSKKQFGSFKDDKQEGFWVEFYNNGNKLSEGNYTTNLKTGEWSFYGEGGAVEKIAQYELDTAHGPARYYFPSGKLSVTGEFHKGKKSGLWTYYFEDGRLDAKHNNLDGNLHGLVINYHPNGHMMDSSFYVHGNKEGFTKSWSDNGTVIAQGFTKNGLREGEWIWRYPNGQVESRYSYINGITQGPYEDYYENGNKKHFGNYLNGKRHGNVTYWHANGALLQKAFYKNGLTEGKLIFYDSTGKKNEVAYFLNDKRHGKTYTYKDGKKVSTDYYDHGFRQSVYSMRDSVMKLIDVREYTLALQGVKTIDGYLKRDHATKKVQSTMPPFLYSRIYRKLHDYKKAFKYNDDYMRLVTLFEGETSQNYYVGLGDRANLYSDLKMYDSSFAIYDKQNAFYKKAGNYYNYLISVYNKAFHYRDIGKSKEGEDILLSEVEDAKSKYGATHLNTLQAQDLLGSFYYDAITDYDKSVTYHKKTLEEWVIAKNPSVDLKKHVAIFTHRLGNSYQSLRKRLDAIPVYKTAILVDKALGAPDVFRLADSYIDLAYDYFKTGKPDSALLTYSEALDFLASVNASQSFMYAKALHGIAETNYFLLNQEQAKQYWNEAEALFRKIGSTSTIDYAHVLSGLAFLNMDQRKFDDAEKLILQEIEIARKTNGENTYHFFNVSLNMATLYQRWGKIDKALAWLNSQASQIEKALGKDGLSYAECKTKLASIHYDLLNYNEAIQHNAEALGYYRTHIDDDVDVVADALVDQARYYRSLNDYATSSKLYLEAVAIIEKYYGNASTEYLSFRSSLAYDYSRQGLYSEATKIFTENVEAYKRLVSESNLQYNSALRDLARCYYDQKEHEKALAFYNESLRLLTKYNYQNTEDYVRVHYRLSLVYYELDKPLETEAYFKKTINLGKAYYGPNSREVAIYLRELGLSYKSYNKLIQAENLLTQAAQIINKTAGPVEYGEYLTQLAGVKMDRDKFQEAEDLYKQALNLVGTNKDNNLWYYVETAQGLALFLEETGRYKEAEKIYEEITILISNRNAKTNAMVTTLINQIGLYYRAKNFKVALEKALEALQFFENDLALSQTNTSMLELHNLIGLIYIDTHEYDKADKQYVHCLEMVKLLKWEGGWREALYKNNMASAKIGKQEFMEAEKLLNESFAIREKTGANKRLNDREYARFFDNFSILYQSWGKLAQAEPIWKTVTQKLLSFAHSNFYFMSDEEKTQLWSEMKEDFEIFNTFAVLRSKDNPNILGDMYNNQLATKAILLSASNKIKSRILGSGDQAMINEYYNWVEMREQLAQFYTMTDAELKEKKHEFDSVQQVVLKQEKELNITADDLDKDRGGKNQVTWRDVQKLLAPNEAAVEIIRYRYFNRYMGDSVLYAVLVLTSETKTNPKLVVLPNGKLLEGRNLRFYKNAIAQKFDDRLSYNAYWSPIEPLVKGKTRIYLSLDGVYNQINLNTLADEQGRFLVDSINLTIISNTKDLLALKTKKAQRKQTGTASLFGYPKYFIGKERIREKINSQKREVDFTLLDERDATGITELPGTKTEVQQVKDILKSHNWNAVNFTDEGATEKALKSISYPSVLHIATHGFFVDENEASATFNLGTATEYAKQNPLLRSGVLLSGASNFIQNNLRLDDENGILTAYEASNLNLDNTDLVVLSACETGKGEVQNGEGVYGLQRAFQTAGAQAIVMSLWKVDDTATQELMSSFYENWMNGSTKAEAFRKAQLQLKSKYNSPYYWGAFVMMGE